MYMNLTTGSTLNKAPAMEFISHTELHNPAILKAQTDKRLDILAIQTAVLKTF